MKVFVWWGLCLDAFCFAKAAETIWPGCAIVFRRDNTHAVNQLKSQDPTAILLKTQQITGFVLLVNHSGA